MSIVAVSPMEEKKGVPMKKRTGKIASFVLFDEFLFVLSSIILIVLFLSSVSLTLRSEDCHDS